MPTSVLNLDASFAARNGPDGIYARCFDDFSTHPDSLSQLDFMADFHGVTNPWPPNRFVTQFFRPAELDHDLVVTIFGEVLDDNEGTGLGARGGSALKRSQPGDDASKIKDVLVLGPPTGANQDLIDLFGDQIITLGQVVKDLHLPGKEDCIKRVQWVKFTGGSTEPNAISVNMPYKYSRPNKSATPTKLQKRTLDMDVSDSKSEELSLSSTYEPERMPDFDQDLCLNGARLVQQPVFDLDAKLVAPWRAPAVFRKGALVAIEAHLIVYHFMADEKPNHLYQLTASRAILLAPSPYEYKPIRPVPRKKVITSRSSMFDKMLGYKK